ncbi:alpha/beta hydrolase [Chryseobacterium oranimense]|uniref:alpha/beta hydrolase n=1 Tax=Chryseobacterium oranimense TaxID=421058 RepID=UPI0021AEC4D8|nr:alpha/beta hydrolase [Chryseobacterium oranimense]UWX59373.1 alpha/beta hydrolase [Chryseobacterium oranimense]
MNKSFVTFLSFLLVCFLWTGCKEKTVKLGENTSFNVEENVSYGNDAEQKLDLYTPENRDSIKGIFVMIHGGGWRGGDKSNLTFFALSMMKKFPDYVFANMNYRLANDHSFILPNQTNDIDSALDILVKKSAEMKFKPEFILLGNSAGAHLSMLYGYNSIFDDKHRTKVKAIVNIVGPTDLNSNDFRKYSDYSFVEKHMIDSSKPTPTDITSSDIANPVFWISETSPPTISYYGNRDQVIPLSQMKKLDSTLIRRKVKHETYEFNGGHLDWDKTPNDQFLIDKIDAFIKQLEKK